MAQKISVAIALEGGKEIERQLAAIGEAGQKAFLDIAKEAEKLGGFDKLNTDQVTAKLKSLGIEGTEAFSKIQRAVETAVRTESLIQGVSAVELAFASLGRTVLAVIPVAIKLVSDWASSINKVVEEAGRLGQSAQAVDQLHKAFERAGVSAAATTEAIKKISEAGDASKLERVSGALKDIQTLAEQGHATAGFGLISQLTEEANKFGPAADKAKEALKQLSSSSQQVVAALGRADIFAPAIQSLQELQTKTGSTKAGLIAFLEQLKGIGDPTLRTAVAFASLSDAGIKLAQSAKAIDEAIAGLSGKPLLTQQQIEAADKLDTALNGLATKWNAFKAAIAEPIAIPLISLFEQLMQAVGGLAGMGTNVANEFQQIGAVFGYIAEGFNVVVGYIGEGVNVIIGKLRELAAAAGGNIWEGFKSAGTAAIDWMVDKINVLIEALKAAWEWAQKVFGSGGGGGGTNPPGHARGGLIGGRGSGTSDSNLALVSRGEYIMPARAVAQPGVLAFLESLRGGGRAGSRGGIPAFAEGGSVSGGGDAASVMASVRQIIDAVAQSLSQLTFTVIDGLDAILRTFSDTVNQIIHEDLRNASNMLWDFEQALKGARGHARGGLLGGWGTGTSDSNLAWVSRGEHIMPALAVQQPGVLAFLEALRRSGGNLSRVLDGMGRYAAGGLVMPSLASGSVGGMNHVTIQFPGLPAIGGLRASSQVVEELQRAAAMAQVRSGGRKPSRYR